MRIWKALSNLRVELEEDRNLDCLSLIWTVMARCIRAIMEVP